MTDIRVYSDAESDSKDSAHYGGSVFGNGEDDKDKKSRAFVACKLGLESGSPYRTGSRSWTQGFSRERLGISLICPFSNYSSGANCVCLAQYSCLPKLHLLTIYTVHNSAKLKQSAISVSLFPVTPDQSGTRSIILTNVYR